MERHSFPRFCPSSPKDWKISFQVVSIIEIEEFIKVVFRRCISYSFRDSYHVWAFGHVGKAYHGYHTASVDL